MSKDSIEHLAWDLIHEKVYPGHPLRWSVLGTEESIKALTRDQMHAYFQRRYNPSNIILIAAGKIDPDQIVATATQLCGDWPAVELTDLRQPPSPKTGTVVQQAERFNQQAIGLVFPAPRAGHPDVEVARAVARVVGGDNSRFFWNIIQVGLAPRAGVYWLGYVDCGMMMLDGLCLPDKAEAFTEAMQREAVKITQHGASVDELQRVKNKRRTSLAVEAEVAYHRLLQVAEDLCDYDRPRTVEERLADVDDVTVERVGRYLSDWPIVNDGFFLSLGPRNWPEI
jgi:predicted Zn-dependent peptidase